MFEHPQKVKDTGPARAPGILPEFLAETCQGRVDVPALLWVSLCPGHVNKGTTKGSMKSHSQGAWEEQGMLPGNPAGKAIAAFLSKGAQG